MNKFKLNISTAQRETIALVFKFTTFFFMLLWDVVFLGVTYWLYIQHLHEGFPQGGFYVLFRPWYIITVILIAIWVTAKAIRRIFYIEWLPTSKKTEK